MSWPSKEDHEKILQYWTSTRTRLKQLKRDIDNLPAHIRAEVEKLREDNRNLRQKVDRIDAELQKSGNILKSIMSIFKFAGQEAKRH